MGAARRSPDSVGAGDTGMSGAFVAYRSRLTDNRDFQERVYALRIRGYKWQLIADKLQAEWKLPSLPSRSTLLRAYKNIGGDTKHDRP